MDLDPYIRVFVSPHGHSNHRHFVDPRPNAHSHLWLALHLTLFLMLTAGRANAVSRLHRASDPGSFPPTPVGVLGGRFRALPLHSTHQSTSCCFLTYRKPPTFSTTRSKRPHDFVLWGSVCIGTCRTENPFVDIKGIELMHVVFLNDHLYEFVAENKGQNHPRDGDDCCIRQGANHGKDARVPERFLSRG